MPIFWSRIVPRGVFFRSLVRSSYAHGVSKDLLTSTTFGLANPRNHVIGADGVSQTLPASAAAGLTDEEILALFSSGFFGGFVFRIESWLLRWVGARFLPARYTGFRPDTGAVVVCRPSAIPRQRLLPVGSLLFNSFLLTDKQVNANGNAKIPCTSSYVDYGFGSDEARFAGCHRFRVTRLPASGIKANDGQIRIDLEHFRCNPKENIPTWAERVPAEAFHYVYEKALFANGIQALMSR
ncbi:hypothetical protein SEUCBS139899_008136 [Sporothrix eucalyptigena]|uniref:Uncharacterized protein n=1 Tax=Sporothrix eucalyptigena TaxID=1812306 RepID=A0ABP0D4N7_9PEZI